MKKFIIAAAAALSLMATNVMADTIYPVDLDATFVQEVTNIFNVNHDGTAFDMSQVSGEVPNIHLYQEAILHVSFIHEAAGYKNQFGVFTYDDANNDGVISSDEIIAEQILFSNVSEDDGTLTTGDTADTAMLPAGTDLGFFIIANGYVDPKAKYYSLPELNNDGANHFPMIATNDGTNIAIGIEDLPWGSSDKDCNDVIFTFTTSPEDAIIDIIDDNEIPVNENPCDDPQTEVIENCDEPAPSAPPEASEEPCETPEASELPVETPEASELPNDGGDLPVPSEQPADDGEDSADQGTPIDTVNPIDRDDVSDQVTGVGVVGTPFDPLLFEGTGCQLNAAAGSQSAGLWVVMAILPALSMSRSAKRRKK